MDASDDAVLLQLEWLSQDVLCHADLGCVTSEALRELALAARVFSPPGVAADSRPSLSVSGSSLVCGEIDRVLHRVGLRARSNLCLHTRTSGELGRCYPVISIHHEKRLILE